MHGTRTWTVKRSPCSALIPITVTPQFSGYGIGSRSSRIADPVKANLWLRESVTGPSGPILLQVTTACTFVVLGVPAIFARTANFVARRFATLTTAT